MPCPTRNRFGRASRQNLPNAFFVSLQCSDVFDRRDERLDRAKFYRRARHAVPLLKNQVRHRKLAIAKHQRLELCCRAGAG